MASEGPIAFASRKLSEEYVIAYILKLIHAKRKTISSNASPANKYRCCQNPANELSEHMGIWKSAALQPRLLGMFTYDVGSYAAS